MRATCLLSFGLLSLTAAPALADGRAVFSSRVCTPGSLAACVSVRMATVTYERPDGSLGTHVVLAMANFYGWDNNATAPDTYIEFISLKTSVPVPRGTGWDGETIGFTGDAEGYERPGCCVFWDRTVPYGAWVKDWSVVNWEFQLVMDQEYDGWFVGCDSRYAQRGDNYISTCRGWAIIKFDLAFEFSANDIESVAFSGRAGGHQHEDIVGCGAGWNEISQLDVPCNVIPEPFTVVLLGSGLAAMGGVGALRRRR